MFFGFGKATNRTYVGLYSQLVLMTIPVGGDIGDEVGTYDT